MKKEYISEIIDKLKASETMLKLLEEGKEDLRLSCGDYGLSLSPTIYRVKPSDLLYEAIRYDVKVDVDRWTRNLKESLGVQNFDYRLIEDK